MSLLRHLLPALLALSFPVLAQEPPPTPEPAAAQAPAAQAPEPKPAPAAPVRAPSAPVVNTPDTEDLKAVVKSFVQALLALDARGATHLAASPFYLEGSRLEGEEAISQALIRQLRSKRTDLLTLYGVDLFTLEELEAKYGKAPARLSNMPLRDRGAMFAVANVSGRAAVMMLKVVQGQWRVVGYHD